MSRCFTWLRRAFAVLAFLLLFFSSSSSAKAATCSITTATVVNQAYVTANSCTAIEINGNVSTTWIGTVDLGGGTVTVKSGYTMTMGTSSQMVLGANDDFVVESNATTTHLAEDTSGVQISARNITISGRIHADSRGCRGGRGATQNGFGPHASTGVCTSNATGAGKTGGGGGGGGSGATHGGLGSAGMSGGGATSTIMYGNSLAPTSLGAGGGQGYYDNAFGGYGGGRIALTATGALTINGSISASGGNGSPADYGWNGGGAGAGGSISITASTLAGSGSVSANGGIGGTGAGANSNGGGHGGGGRVAVRYGSSSLSLSNITATGGVKSGWVSGQNGSTFILNRTSDDGAGILTITSGYDFPVAGDHSRDTISVGSGAFLRCPYAVTSTSLTISSASWISLSSVQWECNAGISEFTLSSGQGLSTTNTTITFGSTTSARFDVPTWTNVTTTISNPYATGGFTVDVDNALEFRGFTYTGPSNASSLVATSTFFTLLAGSNVSMVSSTISSNVSSTIAGSLTLDATSTINANGRGCIRGRDGANGHGPNATTGLCAITTTGHGKGAGGGGGAGGGAAHGGAGGRSESSANGQTTTYGTEANPTLFGSGGGSGYDFMSDSRGEGGNGGGIIRIRVSGALSLAGSITANGNAGNNESAFGYGGGGGGSGGSLYLYVGSLSGNGTIAARGGAGGLGGNGGTANDAGGGGGGRIAIYYSTQSGTAYSGASVAGGTVASGATAGSSGSLYTFQTNLAPDSPFSLGSITLVNGSTTGTVTPLFTFALSDGDVSDTVKFQIQIDNSADFGSLVVDYTSGLAAQGATSFRVGQAAGSGSYSTGSSGQALTDGSYYWRVKALDQNAAESSYVTANSGAIAFVVDSATRTVSFQLSTGSGAETLTATSVRIVLDTTHFENVTVNYAVSSTLTTATGDGTDYTLSSGTATITAGQTSTTIDLVVINDDIDEPNEIIGIELSSPVYASLGATSAIQYSILDNDTAGVTLSKTTVAVTEGGVTDSYTMVLNSQPTSTVRIAVTPEQDEVALGAYTYTFTSLNWSTPQTVNVTAANDAVDEPTTETTRLISAVTVPSDFAFGYAGAEVSAVTASITDNDVAGVTLSKTTSAATEGGATDSYTFTLNSQPTSTIRIAFTTTTYGVTLSANSIDFTPLNWNTPQVVSIAATNDPVAEGEQIAVTTHSLSAPSGFAFGYSSGVSIENMVTTVTDNDTAGVTASASSLSVSEGGSAQTLTYVLDSMPTSTVTLLFTTSTRGITVTPMTLSFTSGNWSTPQAVSVLATDDSSYESTHTTSVLFTVSGSVYGYPDVSPPSVAVTITDNDTSSVTLSASSFTIQEGSSGAMTIVLTSQPTSTVSLGFTVPNQLRVSPSTITFTDTNWNAAQTLTITPVDDNRYAGTRADTFSISINSLTAFANAELPLVTVTITDNEFAPVGGGGAGAGAGIAPPIPFIPPVALAGAGASSPSFSIPSPTAVVNARVEADLRAFKVKAAEAERARFTAFIRFGSGPASQSLGEGERRAVLRDALETMRRSDISQEDLERMASGQIPNMRNIEEERKQVARALPTFKSLFGQAPNFSNPAQNLAWNTLLYRIRFPRDLKAEQQGIIEFKRLFGRAPQDPFQWAVVRVMGYIQQ